MVTKKNILIASIILLALSFTQPAFFIDRVDYDGWSNSFILFFLGFFSLLTGLAGLVWLANPLIILSWIFSFKREKTAILLGISSMILSSSFLFFDEIVTSSRPDYSKITEYKLGYWLWLASIYFFTIATIIIHLTKKENSKISS